MSSLLKRMKKNSTIAHTDVLGDSEFFKRDSIKILEVPLLNVAFSGDLDVGMMSGIHMLAGESKTFKTGFLIQLAKAFQTKHPDGIVLFYDSEGSPIEYWERAGVDINRVLHTPVESVEDLKKDLAKQLSELQPENGDRIQVLVDSIGGLASTKEIVDAEDGKSTVDMTRAKALNSLFRIITPKLNRLDIHMTLINSYYETMELYPKRVYAGGKKVFLSCDDVWFIRRRKIKGDESGFEFVLVIDKSRNIVEGSTFPITVSVENGIHKYSGLYDLAKEANLINVKGAWVQVVDFVTGELSENIRAKDIGSEFYEGLIKYEPFKEFLRNKYQFKK